VVYEITSGSRNPWSDNLIVRTALLAKGTHGRRLQVPMPGEA